MNDIEGNLKKVGKRNNIINNNNEIIYISEEKYAKNSNSTLLQLISKISNI